VETSLSHVALKPVTNPHKVSHMVGISSPNINVEWVALLLYIQEAPGFIFGLDAIYCD
jgi:hypothetical protein